MAKRGRLFVISGPAGAGKSEIVKKLLEKLPGAVRHLYAILAVLVSWAIFANEDLAGMKEYLAGMFGAGAVCTAEFFFYLRSYAVILLLGILGLKKSPLEGKLTDHLTELRIIGDHFRNNILRPRNRFLG